MAEALIELCYTHPHIYKLCNKVKCIPWQQKCPCNAESEFQCSLGNCIPLKLKCDGLQQCMYGEDEEHCHLTNTTEVTEIPKIQVTDSYKPEQSTSDEGLSLPVMVTVVSFSVFIIILLSILLCFYITSRQKKDTSKESQSASEPLQKSYITGNVEDSDSSDQSRGTFKQRAYRSTRLDRSNYLPVNVNAFQSGYQVNVHEVKDDADIFSADSHTSADPGNVCVKGRNMAINSDVEIYNTDINSEFRADGLGKYTFEPTLNYMKSQSCHDIDEENDKLSMRNSYKQSFPGQSNTRPTPTYDKRRDKFSTKFASGLLCSSTPRQCHKQSINYIDVSGV